MAKHFHRREFLQAAAGLGTAATGLSWLRSAEVFGDHESTICKHFSTLDAMLFDCTNRVAYVSRGPGCSGRWKTFRFDQTRG